MATTVSILAGTATTGQSAFEEVLVELVGPGRYSLVRSPGLALGLAAGDVFTLEAGGAYAVQERGGNICIQMFSEAFTPLMESEIAQSLQSIGGHLDGRSPRELVFTIALSVGFPRIEAALKSIVRHFPTVEWYYGNVYDPVDGVTPLDWWKRD